MKKILIIDAGLKPGWTKKTADTVMEKFMASGVCVCERVNLRDEQISSCKGCALCLERGETSCRYFDDSANKVLNQMIWADGIVTVTPNYALQVPAILKNVYDRLAFVFHRPRLFGKFSLVIVVQGVYGGGKIVKYIDELMSFWGCGHVKGAVTNGGIYPTSKLSESALIQNELAITKAVDRMTQAVRKNKTKQPTFFKLAIFRMTRSSLRYSPDALKADKAYFSDMGWFESHYYTEVKLDPVRLTFGILVDRMIRQSIHSKS
ncbi:MAG: flavodoxin family protein [Bacillota bacterium]|nr:flavodoxin family protein [Bacillota bacterium]